MKPYINISKQCDQIMVGCEKIVMDVTKKSDGCDKKT